MNFLPSLVEAGHETQGHKRVQLQAVLLKLVVVLVQHQVVVQEL